MGFGDDGFGDGPFGGDSGAIPPPPDDPSPFITHGSSYVGEFESNLAPIAVALPVEQEAVVGSIVKLDGRASTDPDGSDLAYQWTFTQVPIGSQVERFGFTNIDSDSSVVSFAPDVIGTYRAQLVVFDSNNLASDPSIAQVDIRTIVVPYHQGYSPDSSFIWNYLSDFWNRVEEKEKFETFWSGAIQIVASDLLKAYQYDYNKSIKDIQDVMQRRWLSYEPSVVLDPTTINFILATDIAGANANSVVLDPDTGVQTDTPAHFTSYIGVPKTDAQLEGTLPGVSPILGQVITFGDAAFTLSSINHITGAVVHNLNGRLPTGTVNLVDAAGTFTVGVVGYSVNIISGSQDGNSFIVTAFVDSTTITLSKIGNWPSTETGIEYSITPPSPTNNAVIVDRLMVPTNQKNKPWRISSTLISRTLNFENLGISAGDVILAEIARTDVGLVSTIQIQVTGVDRNRLGFVVNVADLVAGVSGGGLDNNTQIQLSTDLQVPGLFIDQDTNLIYTDQVSLIFNTVNSLKFKRKYFETLLTPDSEINVGAFGITITPLSIIRNNKIPVDGLVVSVPVLQEYIKQPTAVISQDDGTFTIQTIGGSVSRKQKPAVLFENIDYIIDDESTITGTCNTILNSTILEIPFGDLLDRSITSGDIIKILISGANVSFTISEVLDSEHVRTVQPLTITETGLTFVLSRRIVGNYIRFVNGVFGPSNPAPSRLWAEVSYFDNNPVIEANFGSLVGLKQSDLESTNATVSYKSAVAGLMYALTTGSTVSNMALAAQILLGLPFTQDAGIVTEIDPVYKINDDGSPAVGRILIDTIDNTGAPVGITNIYLYQRGRQVADPINLGNWLDADPTFQGIATNPDTGAAYTIGDTISQFVPITNGIDIQQYLTEPDWFKTLVTPSTSGLPLQIYHSFNLLINSDLVTASDIDLAAAFIKSAKPTYDILKSVLLKSVNDLVTVQDILTFFYSLKMPFFDQSSGSVPSAIKFGAGDYNKSFIQLPGTAYTRYIFGDDLVTTKDSLSISSASGGFLNPRIGLLENRDSPFLRAGDLVVLEDGPNVGQYHLASVTSDTTLLLSSGSFNFEAVTPSSDPTVLPRQPFSIYRPIKNPIWWGNISVVNGSNSPTISGGGAVCAGVATGDYLIFSVSGTLWSKRYRVIAISTNLTGNQTIQLDSQIIESSGTYSGAVIREPLTRQFLGANEAQFAGTMSANISSGSNLITFVSGVAGLVLAQVIPGDLVTDTVTNKTFTVIKNENTLGGLRISQNANYTSSAVTVTIQRPTHGNTSISTDVLARLPSDSVHLDLTLSSSNTTDLLVTTNGSNTVSTQLNTNFINLGLRAGDYIIILSGADSLVDTGQGLGVYLVHSVAVGGLSATLSTNLTVSNNFQYTIRRLRP